MVRIMLLMCFLLLFPHQHSQPFTILQYFPLVLGSGNSARPAPCFSLFHLPHGRMCASSLFLGSTHSSTWWWFCPARGSIHHAVHPHQWTPVYSAWAPSSLLEIPWQARCRNDMAPVSRGLPTFHHAGVFGFPYRKLPPGWKLLAFLLNEPNVLWMCFWCIIDVDVLMGLSAHLFPGWDLISL